MQTDQDLRLVPRLRWRQAEDGMTVARCRPRRISRDELYFHGPGKLAIHYFAETRAGATAKRRWWKAKLKHVLEELPGDTEGIIIFEAYSAVDIPKEFFRENRPGRTKAELDGIRPQNRLVGEVEAWFSAGTPEEPASSMGPEGR